MHPGSDQPSALRHCEMGKPLTPAGRDEARRLASQRLTPTEVWKKLKAGRAKRRAAPQDLTTVRGVLKGKTYAAAAAETHGGKRKFSRRVVLNMGKAQGVVETKQMGTTR